MKYGVWGAGALIASILLITSAGGATLAVQEVVDGYDDHTDTLRDVTFDESTNTVWSLDQGGGFIGYDVTNGSVIATEDVGFGHALAMGDGVVYIAERSTLWAYDIESGNLTEHATLDDHAAGMEYDESRDVIWMTGGTSVHGYHAENGSLFMSHDRHTEGTSDIAVQGRYVASATTFGEEVIVYDVETESVAFEPDLPDDITQVSAVHLTENGELIVGTDAEEGSLVAMYDVDTGERVTGYRDHVFAVSDLTYDAERGVIISTGLDNTVKFYDVSAESVVAAYRHEDTIYAAVLDRRNEVLWFGDGEEKVGSVIGLDVSEHVGTATPTPTPSPAAEPSPTPTPTETVEPSPTTAGTPTETADADGPASPTPSPTAPGAEADGGDAGSSGGLGTGALAAGAVIGIVVVALIGLRRRGG